MGQNLSVVGITQTVLFEDGNQYTQLVLTNKSGAQVPIIISDEEALMVINLAEGTVDEPQKQSSGSPISDETEMGEQI